MPRHCRSITRWSFPTPNSTQEALSSAGSLRVHANWFNVDTGLITLPDATIRNSLIQNQVNDSTRHDDWLEGHPDMVDCPSVANSADGACSDGAFTTQASCTEAGHTWSDGEVEP